MLRPYTRTEAMNLRGGVLFADDVGTLAAVGHALEVAGDDEFGNFGGEEGVAGTNGVDGGDEVAHGVTFQDVAEGARIDDFLNHLRRVVHGQHEDSGAGAAFANLPSGLEAVEVRHTDVEESDVGIEKDDFFDGVLAVSCFADYGPAKLGLQQVSQTKANDFVVICQKQPKRDQGSPHVRSAPTLRTL